MRNIIIVIQMLTMVALSIMFWTGGNTRLAAAQACYVIATGFLFMGAHA